MLGVYKLFFSDEDDIDETCSENNDESKSGMW